MVVCAISANFEAATVSVALVLLLLGIVAALGLAARAVTDEIKVEMLRFTLSTISVWMLTSWTIGCFCNGRIMASRLSAHA